MSILDFLTPRPFEAYQNARGYIVDAQNVELNEEISYLSSQVTELQEDMLRISDAFDNAGWADTIMPDNNPHEIKLATVKKVAKIARAMATMNPHIKKGVSARIGYVWGKGVTFDGIDAVQDFVVANRKKLFSPQAYEELERVLATDGNAFTALPVENEKNTADDATAFRISLDEITGVVANPLDKEEIWYYKREYDVTVVNGTTGTERTDKVTKYYANAEYFKKLEKKGKAVPKKWKTVGVEQNYVIHHTAVNKQVGWRWGIPDIMPVIFWAKAYKEYLEDNAMLVKAYSRLAWQVKVPNGAAGSQVAAQVMRAPERDPMTGDLRNVGGTGIHGPGSELAPIAATGSTVDFSKGAPLASAVASGLEVPLAVIISDASAGDRATGETVDLSTLKAMESRQKLHTERFLEIFAFYGADIDGSAKESEASEAAVVPPAKANAKTPAAAGAKPEPVDPLNPKPVEQVSQQPDQDVAIVTWPQIETDSTKDRVTAIGTAVELGVLFKQEARKEVIDVLGIAPYKPWDVLPTMADDPKAQEEAAVAAQNAEIEFQRNKETVVAKQGVSGGTSAKGGSQTSNNASRDNRAADRKNS